MRELTRFKNPIIPLGGHMYWNLPALYYEVLTGLKKAADEGIQLHSIGIDTWGCDFAYFGKDGQLLGLPYCYRDSHTEGAHTGDLDEDILKTLGIERDKFGKLTQPGEVVGQLTPQVQEYTGLGAIDVVAVAGHDTGSAVAAVPAENEEYAYLSCGTWSLLGIETPKAIINEESFRYNFTNEGGIEGTTRFLKNICGLWIFEQCRKEFKNAPEGVAELVALCDTTDIKSLIDPDAPCFSHPVSMTAAINDYCTKTGQTVPQTPAEYCRVIFRSLLCDVDIDRALKAFGIEPDMKGDVRWLHRQDESKDWYFVTPMKMDSFCGSVDFPVSGAVELWNPVTGETSALAAEFKDGRTFVELDMPVAGSCFIVVDRTQKHVGLEVCEYAVASVLDNTWSLSFPEGWDAPSQIEINQLVPWHDLPMSDEAKAFSGKVSYSTSFVVDPSAVGKSVRLDLGTVSSIAEVRINGKTVDTLWCSPYVVEIGEFVQGGENHLEVDVTSTWHNRLVYDASQEVEARKTWVIAGPDAGNALKPYGLLGPVRLSHQK